MIREMIFVAVLVVSSPLQAQSPAVEAVSIVPGREDAIYSVGETATFEIRVPATVTSVSWQLSRDGYGEISKGEVAVDAESPVVVVEGSLDRPGFLMCRIRAGDTKALANVGFDPELITPSREVPGDFDSFWDDQKAQLATVPVSFQLRRQVLKSEADRVELFDLGVSMGAGEKPASGYFARPLKAEAKSCPAVLWVHGAGVRSASKEKAVMGATDGFLSLDLNAHGLPNGKADSVYKDLANGALRNYYHNGRENRDGFYFRGMYLRLVRAIDFLTAQPEWDGKNVAVIGHSQGGLQAIVAGGLDPRVTFIGAGVPAGCDHTGMLRKRISGWPKLVPLLPDGSGKPDPVVAEVSRYFDAVNFASRCQAPAIVSVGFLDVTCPPTSVYAAYNQLSGEKQMIVRPAMKHAAPSDVQTAFWDACRDGLR